MKKPNNKICPTCNKTFVRNHAQKYCSEQCKQEGYNKRNKGLELICINCNKSFIGNKTNKFCSSECKGEHNKTNRPKRIVNCIECGKEFSTTDWAHKEIACSNKCKYEQGKKNWKKHLKVCPVCDIEFETIYKEQVCCSYKCDGERRSQEARERNNDSFPNQRARVEYKRRQRRIKTMVEKVELNRLIVRDKGICQLCGELVDLRVHYNHRLAPTNDHIIPLALGGETSYKNCQLAHRGCNSKKSHFVKIEEVRKWQDQQKVQMC